MVGEEIKKNGEYILTVPAGKEEGAQQMELLRITPKKQVIFNYGAWDMNTATDMFIRHLATKLPDVCRAEDPNALLQQRLLEAEVEIARTQKYLKEHPSKGFYGGLVIGAILGAIIAAAIVNKLVRDEPVVRRRSGQ